MAKTSKLSKADKVEILELVRGELRTDLQEAPPTIDPSPIEESNTEPDVIEQVQLLRGDLRNEVQYLSQLIAKESAEATDARNAELGKLREDVANDLADLSGQVNERSGSPLVPVFGVLAALIVGACGTVMYYEWTNEQQQTSYRPAAISPEINAEFASLHGMLQDQKETSQRIIDRLDRPNAEDALASDAALSELTQQVVALKAVLSEGQPDTEGDKAESPKTEVARPPLPENAKAAEEGAEDKPAQDESAEGEPTETPSEPPVPTGHLIIKNPSTFELNLLVNDVPVTVEAGSSKQVPVLVGRVKTQVAKIPETAKYWDKWESIGGENQLTITVESDANQYWLAVD